MQNRLFVVNKPIFISSNFYLNRIKRKYKVKKAGFSGTLDPFAKGCLIVAFGQYSKLFRFLKKTPKRYRATIWLGAVSSSLDIENIIQINQATKLTQSLIEENFQTLVGNIEYLPPKYSAKRVDGKRAYSLARDGVNFSMKKIKSTIYNIKVLHYFHPFITFEISVSEGSYIRSIAQLFLEKIQQEGTLSYLERLNEGEFIFDNEKALDPLQYIDLPYNNYSGDKLWFELGKKLDIKYFDKKDNGEYLVVFDDFFSIIQITNNDIKYILNKVLL